MSNEIDIDKLEALARAATPGGRHVGGPFPTVAFVAAASPDVVIALIERLRWAEAEIAALKTDAATMDDVARDATVSAPAQ